MRFEHGSHRTECLAALIAILLLLCSSAATTTTTAADYLFASSSRQCLYLDGSVEARDACGPRGRDVRLRHCSAYTVAALLDARDCDAAALERLRRMDGEARAAALRFREIVDRYDCENANSVSWTCDDCQAAYVQWSCAMHLPALLSAGSEGEGGRRPCRYICRLVEQRCPYFHPSVKDQYAGERVFKCIDPDIPDLDKSLSSYGPPHRCYCPQHLNASTPRHADPECRPPRRVATAGRRSSSSGGAAAPARGLPLLLAAVSISATVWWTRTR